MPSSNPKPAQALKHHLMKAVQDRIERVRAKEGLTQAQAAEMLGMTQPRLSALVQGHIELFSLEALIDIAAKLGLAVRLNIARPYKAP
jgi:predicted XRE-type DNA-binding protein